MRFQPRNRSYTVQPGDSLWKIAASQYGDPTLWPHIARNNFLRNRELILVGQVLSLPDLTPPYTNHTSPLPSYLPPFPPTSPAIDESRSRTVPMSAKQVAYPAFKFSLPPKPVLPPVVGPGYKVTFQLVGEVVYQKRGVMSSFQIQNFKEIEVAYEREYRSQFFRLAEKVDFTIDLPNRSLKLSGELTQTVRFNGKDWNSYSVKTDGNKLIFKMEPAPVEATDGIVDIKGKLGYEIVVEIDGQNLQTAPVAVRAYRPILTGRFLLDVLVKTVTVVLVAAIAAVIVVYASALAACAVIAFATVLLFLPTSSGPVPTVVPTI